MVEAGFLKGSKPPTFATSLGLTKTGQQGVFIGIKSSN